MTFEEYQQIPNKEWWQIIDRGYWDAGAASRDAEVVSLTNQRDYEYVRAENAEQERDQFEQESDQLREHVTLLRDVVGHVAGMRFSIVTTKMCEAALAATEPKE